jgi:hypothetical protein
LLFLLFAIVLSQQIPPSPPGRSLGDPRITFKQNEKEIFINLLVSTVRVEMFVDWQCSFSKHSWTTMSQVLQHYGSQVHFVFHVTVLWYIIFIHV